jgi:REP element-mobilizing transposase RayT
MKKNRALFLSGFSDEVPVCMHVVSRIVDRQFLLKDDEREVFVGMMRMYEEFCGVRVLSYCVMSNHFHILLEIPPRMDVVDLSDEAFLAKLGSIYSDLYVKEVKSLMQKINKNQAPKVMRELKAKYTYRMGDMSEFMKSLKQRFTQWYNKKHGRRGTLWEERYSATAVSAGSAARMVAAYIDLNPMRAGMVQDPMDYRWCSYGEAVAGSKEEKHKARSAYAYLYQMADMPGACVAELTVDEAMLAYRMLMAEEGEEADTEALPLVHGQRDSNSFKRRRGYSREEIDEILEKKGKLNKADILRCRTRYFADGTVIGSRAFVERFLKRVKGSLKGEAGGRKSGVKPMRRVNHADKMEGGKIFSFRDLQKDVYG